MGKRNLIEFLTGGITWEGEYGCNKVAEIMSDFNPIKLYASASIPFMNKYNAEALSSEKINDKINNGAGFVLLAGHGWTDLWSTHPPLFKNLWIRYLSSDIQDLHNGEKMPFMFTTGCHCGDFNEVSSPIAWEFVKYKNGGAIASIASTASTIFYIGTLYDKLGIGYLETNVFEAYSNGFHTSGTMLARAQINYLNHVFRKEYPGDYINLEGISLFGDPTLMVGGYTSENLQPVADAGESYSGSPGQTIRFDGSGSYDPNGIIASYSWNFGDGYNGSGMRPIHSYSNEGTYVITLTVTDNNGLTDTDTTTATIDNLDQTQPDDCGYGMNYYENIWLAQGFTPTFETLTRVELKMFRYYDPSNEILTTISIRYSLDGSDLVEVSVFGDEIPGGGWVEFDFSDINVNPGEKYYIVCRADGGDEINHFDWYFGIDNPYGQGKAWWSDNSGSSWSTPSSPERPNRDFCFKTYGM